MIKRFKEKVSGVCMKMTLKKYEMISAVKDRKEAGISTIVIMTFFILIGVALIIIFREKIFAFMEKVFGKLDGAADAAF